MENLMERCRTCSEIVDPGVSLLEPSQQRLNKWAAKNLHLQFNDTNGFPTMMCLDCIASIRSWMVFLQRCQRSQVLFGKEIAKLQGQDRLLNATTSNESVQENVDSNQINDVDTSVVEDSKNTSEPCNVTDGTESAPNRVQLLRKLRLDPIENNQVQKSSPETPEPVQELTNESLEQVEQKPTIESLKVHYNLKNLKIYLHRLTEKQINRFTKVKSKPCPLSKKVNRPHALIKPLPPDVPDKPVPYPENPEELALQIERALIEAEEFELAIIEDNRISDRTSSAKTEEHAPETAETDATNTRTVIEEITISDAEDSTSEIPNQSTEASDASQPIEQGGEVTKSPTIVEQPQQQSTKPPISLPPSALLQQLPKNQPYCIIPMEHESNTFYVINPMSFPQSTNIPQSYIPGFNPWLSPANPIIQSNVRPAVVNMPTPVAESVQCQSATLQQAGTSTEKSVLRTPETPQSTPQIQQQPSTDPSEESMDFTAEPDVEQVSPSEVESLQSNKETSEPLSSNELEKPSETVTPTDLIKLNPTTLECLGLTLEDTSTLPPRRSKVSAHPSKTVTFRTDSNAVHETVESSMSHHTVLPTHNHGASTKPNISGKQSSEKSGRSGRQVSEHALEIINRSLTDYQEMTDSFRDTIESKQSFVNESHGIPVASTSTNATQSTTTVRTSRRNPTIDRLVAALNEIFNPDDSSPYLSTTDRTQVARQLVQSLDHVTSRKALTDTITAALTSDSLSTEASNRVHQTNIATSTVNQQAETGIESEADVLPSSQTPFFLEPGTHTLKVNSQKILQSPQQNEPHKNLAGSSETMNSSVQPKPSNLMRRECSNNMLGEACSSNRLADTDNSIVNTVVAEQVTQLQPMNNMGTTEGRRSETLKETTNTSMQTTSLDHVKKVTEPEVDSYIIDDIEKQLYAMHADSQDMEDILDLRSKDPHKSVQSNITSESETSVKPCSIQTQKSPTSVPTTSQNQTASKHVTKTTEVMETPLTTPEKSTADSDIDFEVLLDIPFSREGPKRLNDSDICEIDLNNCQRADVSFSASEKSDSEEEFKSVLHCSKCDAVFYNNKSFVSHYVTHSYAAAYEVNKQKINVKTEEESSLDEMAPTASTSVQQTSKSVEFKLSESPSLFKKKPDLCVGKKHKSTKKCNLKKVESESHKEVKSQLLICNFCTKRFGQKSSLESHIFCHLSFTLEPELEDSTEVVECKIAPDYSPSRRFSKRYTKKSSTPQESPIKVEPEENIDQSASHNKTQQTRCKICKAVSPREGHKCSIRTSARIQASPRKNLVEPKRSRKIATDATKINAEPSESPSKKMRLNFTPTKKSMTSLKSRKVGGQPATAVKTEKASKLSGKTSKPDVTPTKKNIKATANKKSPTSRRTRKYSRDQELSKKCEIKDNKTQSLPKKERASKDDKIKNKTTKSTRGSRKK